MDLFELLKDKSIPYGTFIVCSTADEAKDVKYVLEYNGFISSVPYNPGIRAFYIYALNKYNIFNIEHYNSAKYAEKTLSYKSIDYNTFITLITYCEDKYSIHTIINNLDKLENKFKT